MTYNIDRAIGSIEGTLKLLLDNQSRAEVSRKQLYEEFKALRTEITNSGHRIETLEKRMDAVEKPVAELNKWRERSIGSLLSLSALAALIGGTLATSWQKILDVMRGW